MQNNNVVYLILGCLLLVGCRSETNSKSVVSASNRDEATSIVADAVVSDSEKELLLAAKEALFQRLSGRLQEVMTTRGPSDAIEVCRDEAPLIAKEVGAEKQVLIGRTSLKLRNPKNQPPHWAKQLVDNATDSATFVKLSNDHAAALLPIKLQSQCLTCHGPRDGIAKDVVNKLARHYPQDQATEFREGDLRGWFWVESQ
jgi:hypothetical protein